MAQPRTIAIDVMGGDFGPEVTIPGAALSLVRHPSVNFILFGDEAKIAAALEKYPALASRSRIVHTSVTVAMHDKPSQALRRGKGSSLWLCLAAVHEKQADVAVSAGNTGALMAMAKLILRPMAGIERPALAALWPTVKSESIVLDVGANIGASARQLTDYAILGAAMARAIFHVERPTVGLLNVGVEEIKGVEVVKEANAWLKEPNALLDYRGFIEGDQIGKGTVDVVVVEGFAGNIALKTAEGTAKQINQYLKDALSRTWASRLGALLARGGFRVLRQKMDPRRVNGATFLGLNGIAVKSHGGTDAFGFASAVDLGYEMAESGLIERIASDLAQFHQKPDDTPAGQMQA
jgi:glycerol-3-phosphate acyltransferase PlsX